MMAVNMAPISTSRIGLLTLARNVFTPSSAAKSPIELLISERPTKSIPNPVSIPPQVFHFPVLANSVMNAPNPAKAEKMIVVEMVFPPNIPRATICAVTVVPIFAP